MESFKIAKLINLALFCNMLIKFEYITLRVKSVDEFLGFFNTLADFLENMLKVLKEGKGKVNEKTMSE